MLFCHLEAQFIVSISNQLHLLMQLLHITFVLQKYEKFEHFYSLCILKDVLVLF